ncbi:hypothetical protein GQ44DRAFT_213792 [Phaeosphaeriaceae sp. PMI808]|nr:hypothetical protein GQ44DRAFT_213792 [Phaeosphaeriaceae sp. PMI808]
MRPHLRPPWPIQTRLLCWHPQAVQRIPRRIATTSATNAAPIDLPKLSISPGSANHDSLQTFLAYAKRTNLDPQSSYRIGTHYEYTTALSLRRLGFSLLRIGRADDAGIDLIGHWVMAPLHEPLRVLVQCKSWRGSVHPCNIRELAGSFRGTPPSWKRKPVMALIITTNKATKGTLQAMSRSTRPMGFVMISANGVIQQFVWNRAAAEHGLEGVGVTLRHTPRVLFPDQATITDSPHDHTPPFKNTGTNKEIQLTWMGSPIFPNREPLDPTTLALMHDKELDLFVPTLSPESAKKRTAGRPRTKHSDPKPIGGVISLRNKGKSYASIEVVHEEEKRGRGRPLGWKKPRLPGRPKGAKNKIQVEKVLKPKRGLGRPKGSKNKPLEEKVPKVKRGVGRPKGSKNKSRVAVVEGVEECIEERYG